MAGRFSTTTRWPLPPVAGRQAAGYPWSLLDLDQDLGALLPPDRVAKARDGLRVAVLRLHVGVWDVSRLSTADPGHLGLLIVDGMLARDLFIEDHASTELVGAGDLVRLWHIDAAGGLLRYCERWSVLAETRVAMLDRKLAIALAQFPEVHAALLDRMDRRMERLALARAIAQLNGVDRRLLALFSHLADRWGRMTTAGVVVPLALSHRALADLVGARRPTVSTALARLARRRALLRRPDGTWLMPGEPPRGQLPELGRFVPPRRRLLAPDEHDAEYA
jgi:CRP/FNR family transcriptional regulator, cyclic AMP receptor protein